MRKRAMSNCCRSNQPKRPRTAADRFAIGNSWTGRKVQACPEPLAEASTIRLWEPWELFQRQAWRLYRDGDDARTFREQLPVDAPVSRSSTLLSWLRQQAQPAPVAA